MLRRNFFKSIAGLFVVAHTDLGSVFTREELPMMVSKKAALSIGRQLKDLTWYIHHELHQQLGRNYPEVEQKDTKISELFPHQFGIDLELKAGELQELPDEAIHQRYVMPVVSRFASELKEVIKVERFGQLPLPAGLDQACRVSGSGIALRGLRAFDIGDSYTDEDGQQFYMGPRWITRFDVLCA